MTQEEKELLLKDLCARLPYKTYVRCESIQGYYRCSRAKLNGGMIDDFRRDNRIYKPFLRPMSSMTEEEIFDYVASTKEERCIPELPIQPRAESTDWLNKNHFDYRGLIPMGLALEATEDMYKI